MATSGTISYTQSEIELINGALRLAGVLDVGEEAQAEVYASARASLNLYLKAFMAKAPQLWRETRGILFLSPGTSSYRLGTDRACLESDFVETTLSADEASGQTALSVTSSAGMTAADVIGIELDDGTRHWTTISTVNSSVLVTVASALTGAASDGATVYTYTTLLARPLRVDGMQRRIDDNDSAVRMEARRDYFDRPNKEQEGEVISAYYSPQLTNGLLYVWPTGSSVNERLHFTLERTLEDMTSTPNNFDLPVEWLETFTYGLATRLALQYSSPKYPALKAEFQEMEAGLLAFDQEPVSLYFAPARR